MKCLTFMITIGMSIIISSCDKDDIISPEYNTIQDIDGNVYIIVQIGEQIWMAENLRTTRYRNGNVIPTNLSDSEWATTTSGAYAIYSHSSVYGINSDAEMVAAYGKLYNWYAVVDNRGLCPEGWHVPSDGGWTILVNYVVGQGYPNQWDNPNGAGNALKSRRQVNSRLGAPWATSEHPRWDSHSTNYGQDVFGISGLPGGGRYGLGFYGFVGRSGYWWSSTEYSTYLAWLGGLGQLSGLVSRGSPNKHFGFSVRCLRDD